MHVAVQGTNSFDDYTVFLRAMGVAMSGMKNDDKDFFVYSIGPAKVNGFVAEFCNLSERGMKGRGKKIKYYKVPAQWVEENIASFDYFAFLSKPNEGGSKLLGVAELNNVEVGIFRY
jgi:hypothetical protein